MVPWPRKCPGIEGKMSGYFLPSMKAISTSSLCCLQGQVLLSGWSLRQVPWVIRGMLHGCICLRREVVLATWEEKGEEDEVFVFIFFFRLLPSMPVPLGQLSSADSGVITTSALLAVLCLVTSTPAGLVAEHPKKRCCVTDAKERELMLENFEDWWGSGRSMPLPGLSSASQLPLITPPVVPPLAILVDVALSTSSRSVALSSRSAEQHRSRHSSGPCPALAPPAIPDRRPASSRACSRSCSRTHQPLEGHLQARDLSTGFSQSCSLTRHPLECRHHKQDPSPRCSW